MAANQFEQVSRWAAEIDRINRRAASLVIRARPEQLEWRPPAGGWSMAEVLEHLTVTNERYLSAMREATPVPVTKAKAWRPTIAGALLNFALQRPKLRMKTPRVFSPGPQPRERVFHEFLRTQLDLRRAAERAISADLRRTRVASPAATMLRLNLGDCFEILVSHAHRHLGQVERIRKQPEFPA
jgi:hypothetical protein